MKLSISLEEIWSDDYDSLADTIRYEINEEIKRLVKREIKNKSTQLNAAVTSYANRQAKEINKRLVENIKQVKDMTDVVQELT